MEEVTPFTEADPLAILSQFVVAFGSAIGNGPHFMVGGTRHCARDYVALVGPTSKARKGDSWQPIRIVLGRGDPTWSERVLGGLSTGEGLIHQVRDPREERQPIKERGRVVDYETVTVDEGQADKRLLVSEPELSRVLAVMARQGNTLSHVVRDAWDHGVLRVMTKTSPERAEGAHIVLVSHITIDELRRELPDTAGANGFANRFMWFAVWRRGDLPEPEPFEGDVVNALSRDVSHALDAARCVGRMERDERARQLWIDVYGELAAEREGLAGAILARAEAHVLRLSMLYALVDGSPLVQVEHLAAALELWAYAERSVLYIFGDATGDPTADTILRSLRSNGGLTRTAISGLFGRHTSSDKIAHGLQLLLERGKARMGTIDTSGRPAECWEPL